MAQRVQEFAVHYVLLEQQYLEVGIKRAVKRDRRPASASQSETMGETTADAIVQESNEQIVDSDAQAQNRTSTQCSSMVDEVFLLLQKSCVRGPQFGSSRPSVRSKRKMV